MNTGTAVYWFPVTTNEAQLYPHRYEGYGAPEHDGIGNWLDEALDWFTDIYGTVVNAHYLNEEVSFDSESNYHFILNIVVTSISENAMRFNKLAYSNWGKDLGEQLTQAEKRVEMDNIVSWDLNPLHSDPLYAEYSED